MVNKEKQEKDGFGLPSTDVRKKDNALIEAARIADKMAKWYAEFGDSIKEVSKKIEVEDEDKALEEQKKKDAEIADALKAEKAKADKIAELKAKLAKAEEA